jgi:hypothetical protein
MKSSKLVLLGLSVITGIIWILPAGLRSALVGESGTRSRTADLIENQEREIASLDKLLVKARRRIYKLENQEKFAVASTNHP